MSWSVLTDPRTQWVPIILGVPEDSALGPLLFILYTSDILSLSFYSLHIWYSLTFSKPLVNDDAQTCVHWPPSAQLFITSRISSLSQYLHIWMFSNRLSLNSSRTYSKYLGWQSTVAPETWLMYAVLSERFPPLNFFVQCLKLRCHCRYMYM